MLRRTNNRPTRGAATSATRLRVLRDTDLAPNHCATCLSTTTRSVVIFKTLSWSIFTTMPKTQRTPPKEIQHSASNPDITNASQDMEFLNITSRAKKPRIDLHSSELQDFRDEIREMLSSWKKDQEQILHKLSSDVAEVKLQNEKIHNCYLEMEKSLVFTNAKYEEIKSSVEDLGKERRNILNLIDDLERKILDMQVSTRSSTIEIRNLLPAEKNVPPSPSLIVDTCKALNIDILPSDVRDVYSIPNKEGDKRSLIAEFQTVALKNNVLAAVRKFNKNRDKSEKLNSGHLGFSGTRTPIYISDRLSGTTRKLFFESRAFANANGFKFCWTANGKVLLRKEEGLKSIIIKSKHCLEKLGLQK